MVPQSAIRERRDRVRGGGHGNQVGAGVAERLQPSPGGVPPHLRAQPAGLETQGADPRADEDVRHRVAIADGKHGAAIPLIE